MEQKLETITRRYHTIETELSQPQVIANQNLFRELNREYAELTPVIQKYAEYRNCRKELEESREIIREESDPEMREMLHGEIDTLEKKFIELEQELVVLLLPRDPGSGKDVIVEIRAGTGGEEAALFAADLFRMYSRYADLKGWRFEVIEANATEIGGYKEVLMAMKSADAYDHMKFESGVHRVQRVPSTESGGRIHTSAVTVAVMVEAEENEIDIPANDVRIDVYRSSGHGGQSVNTTDSAVRLTHLPTGMVVTCQDEKSQLKNKLKAMRVLRARLMEKEMAERMAKESELRKSQVGSGDRSERIRTYNYPQSRVTDHRIGLTLYSLEKFLDGDIEEIIEALRKFEIEQKLKNLNG